MRKFLVFIITLFISALTFIPVNATEKNNYFELIDEIIEAEVLYGLSGVQLVVMKENQIVKSSNYGYTSSYLNVYDEFGESILDQYEVIPLNERVPVKEETLFDLASNTKMYATNYAIQYLITKGKLSLDSKINEFFPNFAQPEIDGKLIGAPGHDILDIGHLLRHDSGFIASPKYHDNTVLTNLGQQESGVDYNYLYTQDESEILDKLLSTPLEFEPGTVVRYSDVDFMLLGKIVELVSELPLDEFLDEYIYGPLGINNVMFNPLDKGIDARKIAATELNGNTRGGRVIFWNPRTEVLQGTVHDEKAWHSFAGVAGHAGLFGNANDIAKLASLMLNNGTANGIQIFDKQTIEAFSQPAPLNDTYGYGWRRQGNSKGYGWAFSDHASLNTLGHTGWTGTITQIDPQNDVIIVLLTNARNSPIMGPDKNDFFTKAFKTNDYGTITTLAYEALGLGNNIDGFKFVKDLAEKEIVNIEKSISNRNALRSLLQVIKSMAIEDELARDFILNEDIVAVIQKLNETFDNDTVHLDVSTLKTTNKDELIELVEYLEKFDDKEIQFAKQLIEDVSSTQEQIDEMTLKLSNSIKLELLDSAYHLVDELNNSNLTKFTEQSVKNVNDAKMALIRYLENDEYNESTLLSYIETFSVKISSLIEKEIEIVLPTENNKNESSETLPSTGYENRNPLYPIVMMAGGMLVTWFSMVKSKGIK